MINELNPLTGYDAANYLEERNVFDKPIIACHKSIYDDSETDLMVPPLIQIGRDYLGQSFGLTWHQTLVEVHRRDVRPIEKFPPKGLWIHFLDGSKICLDDATRLAKISVLESQVTLCILGTNKKLYITYSVFFDNPASSGLQIDSTKVRNW